ncbi:hypothetical protein DXG03_008807, partial [Asterophora parasitica]
MSESSAAETNFNYIVGGFSILAVLYSAHVVINRFLPKTQMEFFDSLLLDTKCIYTEACADNLLPAELSRAAKTQLQIYQDQADILRVVKYRSASVVDIIIVLFGGGLNKIENLKKQLMELRNKLVTASQEARAHRVAEEAADGGPQFLPRRTAQVLMQ